MINLLPYDGIAFYYNQITSPDKAKELFTALQHHIEWKNDEIRMYGRLVTTKRKVAWYGDKAYEYTYSGIMKKALPWTAELQWIKEAVEYETGDTFNSCLLNLYHNGEEGMGWHSDNESSLQREAAIASVSLGAERIFLFKHKKTKETISLLLEQGSLLVMKGATQTCWLHSLPKSKKQSGVRINLTFRTMAE